MQKNYTLRFSLHYWLVFVFLNKTNLSYEGMLKSSQSNQGGDDLAP